MNEVMQPEVSASYGKALALSRRIVANAQAAQESLYEVCKGLKEMRDGKLYKELGYDTFEEYCETEIGFSREQGRKYAAIAEKLPEDFANSSWQIGVTKLFLLTQLDDEERGKLTENVDLESTSVRNLKAEIEALKSERDTLKSTADAFRRQSDEYKKRASDAESASGKSKELEARLKQANDAAEKAKRDAQELQNKIKELQEAPQQVAVEDMSKIEELTARLQEADKDHAQHLEYLRQEYEKKLAEAASQAKVVTEQVVDSKPIFKAYLASVVDAATRMLDFMQSNSGDANIALYSEKAFDALCSIASKVEEMKGA